MTLDPKPSSHEAWTRLRFSIIGPLLSAPPEPGELRTAIVELARKSWCHPTTGEPVSFGESTIERWYYKALRARTDPLSALRRRVRKDSGTRRRLSDRLVSILIDQHRLHPHWTYKLHADNLAALIEAHPELGARPSYPTVTRFMKSRGLFRRKRQRRPIRPGMAVAETRLECREVRSFEMTHVGSLWHLDFHHGSLPILIDDGSWATPIALAILDDYSRLCCHAQWYLGETTEDLVHGLSQGFQKRGLPRSLLTDNGSAMIAAETTEGLSRLGIIHETTLAYSPYQNGKQESFWGTLEGRLLAMLDRKKDLSLSFLNEATQAWVEMEYNRTVHSETGMTPLERFLNGPDVSRESPSGEGLRLSFRFDERRTQRRSDGTVSLSGVRFEIPSRFRHLERLVVRYARWNLGLVHLVDERSGVLLCPIYPLDKQRNADGLRRSVEPITSPLSAQISAAEEGAEEEVAPLLRKLLEEYAATGTPPGYLPKTSPIVSTPPSPKDTLR
jgi:putative transposase